MKKSDKIKFYKKKQAQENKQLFDDIIKTYEKGGLKYTPE